MNKRSTQQTTTLWLEQSNDDFPFYNEKASSITVLQWLVILASLAVGFSVLTLNLNLLSGTFGGIARSTLFAAIPLTVFYLTLNTNCTAIFRKLQWRDSLVMFAIALLNLTVTIAIGAIFIHTLGADTNVSIGALKDLPSNERLLFFVQSLPQLFGEELLTVLPFLAITSLCFKKFRLSRTQSVICAWLLSSLIFGLAHLPSYNWNWLQCIAVIGSARLILTLAYIRTKNIWVSTGAHIINDWTIFLLVMVTH